MIGAYGAGNLGDEAILQGMLLILEKRGIAKKDITVITWSPEETTSFFGVPAILRDLEKELPTEHDKLILGGGGVIYRGSAANYVRRLKQYSAADKEVEVYGVGTDNLDGVAPMVRDAFNDLDALSVRTPWDKHHLQTIGVTRDIELVDCPSLLIPTPPQKEVMSMLSEHFDISKPLVGICIKPWRIQTSFTSSFLKFLAKNFCPHYTFVPLVMCRHRSSPYEQDEVSLKALCERLGLMNQLEEWFMKRFTPSFMKGIVQSMNHIITNRKHPLIFAAQKGIPVTIIEDSPSLILTRYARCFGVNLAWIW